MLRYHVTALPPGPFFIITPEYASIPLYGSEGTAYMDLATARFLLAASGSSEEELICRHAGSKPVTTSAPIGIQRDKGVIHSNIDADIYIPGSTLIQHYSQNGVPEVERLSDHMHIACDHPHVWGEDVSISRTVPSYGYTYLNMPYEAYPSSGIWNWDFDGNGGVLTSFTTSPLRHRAANPPYWIEEWVAPVTKATISAFRREGSNIYYFSDLYESRNGNSYSGSEVAAKLAAIPDTGGSLCTTYPLVATGISDPQSIVDSSAITINEYPIGGMFDLNYHPTDFGDLSIECAKQLRFVDQNVLLLAYDVANWKQFSTSLRTLLNASKWLEFLSSLSKVLKTPVSLLKVKSILKTPAAAYLFTKYAVLPNISDIERLMLGIQRSSLYLKHKRLHSKRITPIDHPSALSANHTAVLTVECDEYPTWFTGKIQEFISGLKKWGIYPELVNLWDMVPYSFVIDWFIQFGDLFEECDTWMNVKEYFPVHHVIYSEKWETVRSVTDIVPEIQATGEVCFSYYVRETSLEVPLPNVSLHAEARLSNHLVESSALVLQRL